MTCIVAVTDGKKIVMGGDSAGVSGYSLTIRKDKKVFKRKDESGTEWLFGFTTSFRMGELVQFELELPEITPEDKQYLYRFMVMQFIPSLRKCLKEGGWATIDKNIERGGTFIVALLGEIFVIGSDYQVGESLDLFDAVGCGEDIAKGSLYTSQKLKSLKRRALLALEAAQRLSAGVREPFNIIESN